MTVYTAAAVGGRRYCNRCGEVIGPGDAVRLTDRAGKVVGHLCSACAYEAMSRTDYDAYRRDAAARRAAATRRRPPP